MDRFTAKGGQIYEIRGQIYEIRGQIYERYVDKITVAFTGDCGYVKWT